MLHACSVQILVCCTCTAHIIHTQHKCGTHAAREQSMHAARALSACVPYSSVLHIQHVCSMLKFGHQFLHSFCTLLHCVQHTCSTPLSIFVRENSLLFCAMFSFGLFVAEQLSYVGVTLSLGKLYERCRDNHCTKKT